MKKLFLLAVLILASCGETVVIDKPVPGEIKQVIDWDLQTVLNKDGRLEKHILNIYIDSVLTKQVVSESGTLVNDLVDEYLVLSKMMVIEREVLENPDGSRIIPTACATGGSVNNVTFKSLPPDDPYYIPVQKDPVTVYNVKTCATLIDVSAKINNFRFLEFRENLAVFEVEATEPVQCIIEYGTEPGKYTLQGVPERSFDYTVHKPPVGN